MVTEGRIDNISMQTSPSRSDINQSDRTTKLLSRRATAPAETNYLINFQTDNSSQILTMKCDRTVRSQHDTTRPEQAASKDRDERNFKHQG